MMPQTSSSPIPLFWVSGKLKDMQNYLLLHIKFHHLRLHTRSVQKFGEITLKFHRKISLGFP